MFVFPESRPDYFSTIISSADWKKEVDQLSSIPAGSIPCLTENGFASAGIVYAIWQKIKGFFGFQDETDELKISGRIFKLLFIGKACSYDGLQALQEKIAGGHLRVHQAVQSAFQAQSSGEIRNQLVRFYQVNQNGLQPSFWNRLGEKKFEIIANPDFGDTYLAMAQGTEEFSKALSYYRLAAQLYNIVNSNESGFLSRLTISFLNFANGRPASSELGEVFLLLAQGFMSWGSFDNACMTFEKATQFGGVFSLKLKEQHLIALVEMGDWDEAKALSNELVGQVPFDGATVKAHLKMARNAYQAGRYDEAARFYERASQNGAMLSPEQKELQFIALSHAGRWEEAKEISQELTSRAPYSGLTGEGHLRIAEEAFRAKRYEEAALFFSKAADLTLHQRVLWMRAATYTEQWDVVKKLAGQLPSDVQDPAACLQLAESASSANRFDEACLFFERAIRNGAALSPEQKELWFIALFRLGKFEEAKALSCEIADRAPFQGAAAEAHFGIAEESFLSGRYEEAALFFSRAADPSPRQQALWMVAAVKTGQFALAERLAKTARDEDATGEAYLLLAERAYADKRMKEAAGFFQRASVETTAEEKLHWMIAAALTGQFEVAEDLSFAAAEPRANDKKFVQTAYLLLAENKDPHRFYQLAYQNGAELTFRQFGFWLIGAAEIGDWKKAEWISQFLPNPIPDNELQEKIAPLYARLGEEAAAREKFSEAEAFFLLAYQNKAALTDRQKALSFLASAKCGHFGEAEKLPQIIDYDLKREIGGALLILAQRKWDANQIEDAERLYALADQNEAALTLHQKALWLIASVKGARFDRAERLFSEIQAFSPKENLKAPLAEAMISLGSYHAAKREPVQRGFFSYFWGEASGDAKAIACFERAMRLIPAEDRKTTECLVESLDSFASRLSTPDSQIGAIYLQLAERMHSFQQLARADNCYLSATKNQITLNSDQTARWMLSAAKTQNKATVLSLANQVADSSLGAALRTTVQDTYLQLATTAYEEKKFEQADLFYQLASRLNAPLTLEQKAFWILSAAQMGRPAVAELFADEDFEPLQSAIKREIGTVFLAQAERECELENYKTADRFFQLADQNRVSFTLRQQIRWFYAAVEAKNLSIAERLAAKIEECRPKNSLQKLYLSAMIRLADQLAALKGDGATGYLPSWFGSRDPLASGRKAALYYYRVFSALEESDPLRMEILVKISQTAHCLQAGELEMALPFHSSHTMERIYSHLALIVQQDSLGSPTHRISLNKFTHEMWTLYQAGKRDEALSLIEEAILGLDVFKKVLVEKKSFFGTALGEVQSHIPGLITPDGKLAFNIGAGLYFLKGEILREAEGDTRRVLDAYVAAGHLAPNNFFGAGAFLWRDDQIGQNLALDIKNYRNHALEWGAGPE